MPRSDLHVSTGGVAVKPALGLGLCVALEQGSDIMLGVREACSDTIG